MRFPSIVTAVTASIAVSSACSPSVAQSPAGRPQAASVAAGDEVAIDNALLHDLRQAARALGNGDPNVVAAAWQRVLKYAPEDGEAWYAVGYADHRAERFEQALVAHRRAAGIPGPFRINAAYNAACALARLGRADEAISALGEAVELGYANIAHIQRDSDLESVRQEAGLAAAIERIRQLDAEQLAARPNVVVLLYPDVELLDFAGPVEAFGAARKAGKSCFRVVTVAASRDPITVRGMTVVADHAFADCPQPDVLVIPGGGSRNVIRDEASMAWLRQVAPAARLRMSVCTGAFVLAELGVLAGRAATTHHNAIPGLTRIEGIDVRPGTRFVADGDVITAAGVSAGIDASLHAIEQLCGRDVADSTARYMEYEWRRDRIGPYGVGDPDRAEDRAAVAAAVIDYLEALHRGGVERVERSVHPDLDKFGLAPAGSGQGGARQYAMDFSALRGAAEKLAARAPIEAPWQLELLDLQDHIAVVKVRARWGSDYVLLGRFDGRWLVRQVLWQRERR